MGDPAREAADGLHLLRLAQLIFKREPRGDIARDRLHADRLAALFDDLHALPDPELAAALGDRRKFKICRSDVLGPLVRVKRRYALPMVLADQRDEVLAQQLLFGELRQPRGRRVHEGEAAFQIAVVDDVGGLLGELAVPHFSFTQGLFGLPAFGDVAVIDDNAADARVIQAVDSHAFNVAPGALVVPDPEGVLY